MDSEYSDFFAQQAAAVGQMTREDTEQAEFNQWMSEQFPTDSGMASSEGGNVASDSADMDASTSTAAAPAAPADDEPSGGYSPSAIPLEHQERAYSPSAPNYAEQGYSPSAIPAALVDDDASNEAPQPQASVAPAAHLAQEERTATPRTFELQQEALQLPTSLPPKVPQPNGANAAQALLPSIVPTPAETPPARAQASLPSVQSSTPDGPPLTPLQAARARAVQTKHDQAAWKEYLTMAENTADLDTIRDAYEDALKVFPNVAQIQIAYLNHYLHPSLFQKAETLFARFLRPSPSVELWKFYLTYVRRINTNVTDATVRDTVRKAYEFALSHVGHDMDAGQIWRDYIDFLKAALDARTTWDQQQKMDLLRSAYHRAVVIPLDNVEALWRELDTYENSLNKITAKKFLQDLSPAYMTAKAALRDLKKLLAPIATTTSSTATPVSSFNLPPYPTWAGEADRTLSNAWKAYLKWEEGNPLVLDDQNAQQVRILSAYRKATARMRFFPDIIYLAFHALLGMGKAEEALTTLKQGIESNPASYVLSFAYAEYQETQKNFTEVHSTFDNLIAALHRDLEQLEQNIEEEVVSTKASILQGGLTDDSTPAVIEAEDRARKVRERRSKEVETAKNELGLVWIMLMRFARRSEGLKPARTVFAKARKDKWCAWIVYEAAALMEYHCTKAADVATKIFEIGLKQYGEVIDFVVRYLGFLISINDENNARALFERTITTFQGEKGRPLWERWARYEYHFSDLTATQKLEQRIAEALPSNPPIKQFAYKYTYLNVDAIASRDLGFGAQTTAPAAAVAPKTEAASTPVPNPALNLPPSNGSGKRAASPARRRDPSPPPSKRFKGNSPPPGPRRDYERDRGGRDYPRRGHSPHRHRGREIDAVPEGVVWFLGSLPSATAFDGPKFRTDDLMHLFKTANIPTGPDPRRSRSPPPIRGGGRPPPDYTLGGTRGGGGGRRF